MVPFGNRVLDRWFGMLLSMLGLVAQQQLHRRSRVAPEWGQFWLHYTLSGLSPRPQSRGRNGASWHQRQRW